MRVRGSRRCSRSARRRSRGGSGGGRPASTAGPPCRARTRRATSDRDARGERDRSHGVSIVIATAVAVAGEVDVLIADKVADRIAAPARVQAGPARDPGVRDDRHRRERGSGRLRCTRSGGSRRDTKPVSVTSPSPYEISDHAWSTRARGRGSSRSPSRRAGPAHFGSARITAPGVTISVLRPTRSVHGTGAMAPPRRARRRAPSRRPRRHPSSDLRPRVLVREALHRGSSAQHHVRSGRLHGATRRRSDPLVAQQQRVESRAFGPDHEPRLGEPHRDAHAAPLHGDDRHGIGVVGPGLSIGVSWSSSCARRAAATRSAHLCRREGDDRIDRCAFGPGRGRAVHRLDRGAGATGTAAARSTRTPSARDHQAAHASSMTMRARDRSARQLLRVRTAAAGYPPARVGAYAASHVLPLRRS